MLAYSLSVRGSVSRPTLGGRLSKICSDDDDDPPPTLEHRSYGWRWSSGGFAFLIRSQKPMCAGSGVPPAKKVVWGNPAALGGTAPMVVARRSSLVTQTSADRPPSADITMS